MKDTSRAWSALTRFRDEACQFFKEREPLVECGLVALLSNSHLFILGPPGTAKSMLAQTIAGGIGGASYCYSMMHKFITWRDLACGEVIVNEEQCGGRKSIRFRNTEGALVRAHFIFLDELFKASAATNNSILNLLEERIYSINPGEISKAPLLMAVGASNEMPSSGEDQLRAFADRFLLWYEVNYVGVSDENDTAFIDMLAETGAPPSCELTLEDVLYLRSEAQKLVITRNVLGFMNSIRAALRLEHRIEPSDRRFKQSIAAIKAFAFLNGNPQVGVSDLAVLEHILWAGRDREVRDAVRKVVREFCGDTALTTVENLFREATTTYHDTLSLLDRADRELPIDETRRNRQRELRDEALIKERRITEPAETMASSMSTIASRRALAAAQYFLNRINILRKALINRRGVEDPFVGAAHATH